MTEFVSFLCSFSERSWVKPEKLNMRLHMKPLNIGSLKIYSFLLCNLSRDFCTFEMKEEMFLLIFTTTYCSKHCIPVQLHNIPLIFLFFSFRQKICFGGHGSSIFTTRFKGHLVPISLQFLNKFVLIEIKNS